MSGRGHSLTRVELVQHVDSADLVRKSPSLAKPRSKKDRLKISICILRLDFVPFWAHRHRSGSGYIFSAAFGFSFVFFELLDVDGST